MMSRRLCPPSRVAARTLLLALLAAATLTAQHYTQTNLASGVAGAAPVNDPNLKVPWGLSRSSAGPWWVTDKGSGLSTLYTGTGTVIPLVVAIPGGSPIATVYNGTGAFALPNGKPAVFLFASSTGLITGWAPGSTSATVVVNNPGAAYYGLAIASFGGQYYLYAADFANAKIDVYDSNFNALSYTEPGITDAWFTNYPNRGLGYSPFNIQNIGNTLYIAFARPSSNGFVTTGSGAGVVAAFTPQGQLVKAFQSGPWMNAPWGLALAPGDFGMFSHDLLVGEFGSGQIVAYNITSGNMDGIMEDSSGNPITIPGLWALSFGAGNAKSGPANSLYFTAGFDGLFGTLTANSTDQVLGNGN
jgi:uncharacterized protein (TIGR03118 family)